MNEEENTLNTPQKFEFLLKKLVQILLSMLVLSILVFFIARLSPGDLNPITGGAWSG